MALLVGRDPVKRAALLLVLALSACGGAQTPLDPAGAQASDLYNLFRLMLLVCGAMYAAVLLFLGWGMVRRRARTLAEPDIDPADRGLTRTLTVWAAIIVCGLTLLITGSFFADRGYALSRAHETLTIRVTAHQWWWRIQYRDPASGAWFETANELHLPAGETARVELGSADVIHSFWVPNVAGKMDVIPGRANLLDLTPRRIGWYRGQCAEFCGPQHAHMAFDVRVESPAAFAAWLAAQARPAAAPADAAAARGMAVVTQGPCAMCHVVRGTPANGRPGPDLTHLASRRSIAAGTLPMTRGAVQGWVAQPQALKPGTMMPPVPLSPADADAVSRYLVSLK